MFYLWCRQINTGSSSYSKCWWQNISPRWCDRARRFILYLDNVILSFGIVSQIECSQLKIFIMLRPVPNDHRVVISLASDVFVIPLVFLCLEYCERWTSFLEWPFVVRQFQTMITVIALLSDTHILIFDKSINKRLLIRFIHVLMIKLDSFVRLLQFENLYFVATPLQHHEFFIFHNNHHIIQSFWV
jgi:hypothetical protein